MAWLWSDTLADLLETVDGVGPEALGRLRAYPVAYRLDDGGDPIALARSVLGDAVDCASGAVRRPLPPNPGLRAMSGHFPPNHPV
jgi:hypothetical protein